MGLVQQKIRMKQFSLVFFFFWLLCFYFCCGCRNYLGSIPVFCCFFDQQKEEKDKENEKDIQVNYDKFRKCLYFAKYFLLNLGW